MTTMMMSPSVKTLCISDFRCGCVDVALCVLDTRLALCMCVRQRIMSLGMVTVAL